MSLRQIVQPLASFVLLLDALHSLSYSSREITGLLVLRRKVICPCMGAVNMRGR